MRRNVTVASLVVFFALLPLVVVAIDLKVPFIVQAPYNNWKQPYQDACEEATILMLDAFYDGDARARMDAAEANRKILDLVDLEWKELGYHRDTDISTMVKIINDHFSFYAYVVEYPTLARIKNAIDFNNPVVVPVWGRDLESNPYFTPPGPTYHTIVISGYDDGRQQFITQEPGTRNGGDFRYSYKEIMNALADFVPDESGKPAPNGKPTALFTSKADLIKTANDPRVYIIRDGKRRHIVNEKVFLDSGFKWSDIRVVSELQLNQYPSGLDLTDSLR